MLIGEATVVGTPLSIGLAAADAATFHTAHNAGTYPGGYRFDVLWDLSPTIHRVISVVMAADLLPTIADNNAYYISASAYATLEISGIDRYISLNRIGADRVEFVTTPSGDDLVAGMVFKVWGLP